MAEWTSIMTDSSFADKIGAKARVRNSGPRKFVSTLSGLGCRLDGGGTCDIQGEGHNALVIPVPRVAGGCVDLAGAAGERVVDEIGSDDYSRMKGCCRKLPHDRTVCPP
jgi:hypothetical protein